jgi:antitoxin component YwqK of YwqJK toxin-antitoxin module
LDFPYYQTDYCSPTKKWANLSKKDHQLLFDFQNGKSELTWKDRFERVYAKGRLRQKKPIGIWEYFFFDGRLKETGYYLEGEKEGEWLTFFHPLSVCMVLNLPPSRPSICDFSQVSPPNPAGWVSSVTPYTDGKINGTVLTYDESGCIRSEANYVDGVLVGSIQTY